MTPHPPSAADPEPTDENHAESGVAGDDRGLETDDRGTAPVRLSFAYGGAAPAVDELDVKRVRPTELLGVPAALVVVGESHCVSAPALGFREVCSCSGVGGGAGDRTADPAGPVEGSRRSVPLAEGVERRFETVTGGAGGGDASRAAGGHEGDVPGVAGVRAVTVATAVPMTAFPGPDGADAAYRFGPEAWTTLTVDGDGYETYHTYPEHGRALRTETRLSRLASGEAADAKGTSAAAGARPTSAAADAKETSAAAEADAERATPTDAAAETPGSTDASPHASGSREEHR